MGEYWCPNMDNGRHEDNKSEQVFGHRQHGKAAFRGLD